MQVGYLIDTNVISEQRRREPEPRVVHWIEQKPAGQLYLSVLTLGEIRRGVEKLQQGERQRTLRIWLEQELQTFFAGRVLPIDGAVAHRWGQLMAKLGRPLPAIDSLAGGHGTGSQSGADHPQSQGCGGLVCCSGQSLGSGWNRTLMLCCVSGVACKSDRRVAWK
jgi:predicted nucleic acid-binding protein